MSKKSEKLTSEIERLQAKLAEHRRELAAAKYREASEQRRLEARRNMIVGEAVWKAIQTGTWGICQFNADGSAPRKSSLEQLFAAFVTREKDREILSLPASTNSDS
jgi:hypothetical protein